MFQPLFSGRGGGSEIKLLINRAYKMKPSCKIPTVLSSESFQIGGHIYVPGEWCILGHKDRSSLTQEPSRFHPIYILIWLFICILYYITPSGPVHGFMYIEKKLIGRDILISLFAYSL